MLTVFLAFLCWRLSLTATQRKQAEKALSESENRLAEAQRIAHLGSWDWDIINNTLIWSNEIYQIFGVSQKEFNATYDAFFSFVHPEDKKKVMQSVDAALNAGKPYSIEYRILRSDGLERIVYEQAEVIYNDQGKAIRMIGTVQDVTELKRAIEQVKQLKGMLPICSHCKKIRDDKGYWNQIEAYIQDHSEAEFSHSICQECAEKHYPDYDIYDD